MASAAEFQAKVTKATTNMDRLDGIVNGPATGSNSQVTTDNGLVKTFARTLAENEATLGDAQDQINTARDTALTAVNDAGTTQVTAVETQGTTQVTAVGEAGSTALTDIGTAGTSALTAISDDRGEALTAIGTLGEAVLNDIGTAGTGALTAISDDRATALTDIGAAKDTALTEVSGAADAVATSVSDAQALYDGVAAVDAAVTAAGESAAAAQAWSETPEDTEVETGLYSARHWAAKAEEAASGTPDLTQESVETAITDAEAFRTSVGAVAQDGSDIAAPDTFKQNIGAFATQADAEAFTTTGALPETIRLAGRGSAGDGGGGDFAKADYEAETVAVLSAMTTAPADGRAYLLDRTIRRLKETGLWSLLGVLWLPAAHDQQAATLNIKSPAQYPLVNTNGVGFTADSGFIGDDVDAYLATALPINTIPGYTQNSAHLGVIGSGFTANDNGIGQFSGAASVLLRPTNGTDFQVFLNGPSATFASGGVTSGHFVASRGSSTTVDGYVNGAPLGAAAASTSTAPPSEVLASLRYSSTYSPATVRVLHAGAHLTADQVASLNSILNGYLDGLARLAEPPRINVQGEWYKAAVNGERVDLRRFGAVGSSSANTALFQRALEAHAAEKWKLGVPADDYLMDAASLILFDNTDIKLHPGARLVFPTSFTDAVRLSGSKGTNILSSDDLLRGSSGPFTLASVAGLKVGQRVEMGSTRYYGRTNVNRAGEQGYIAAISGNDVTLSRPLYDTYLVADGAYIAPVTATRNVKWDGGLLEGSDTGASADKSAEAVVLRYGESIRIDNLHLKTWQGGLFFDGVFGGSARGGRYWDIMGDPSSLGYCTQTNAGSEGILLVDHVAWNCGKIWDNGGSSGDRGVARNITVRDSGGFSFVRQVFGSHAPCDGVLLDNLWGDAPQGSHIRGNNVKIHNANIRVTGPGNDGTSDWALRINVESYPGGSPGAFCQAEVIGGEFHAPNSIDAAIQVRVNSSDLGYDSVKVLDVRTRSLGRGVEINAANGDMKHVQVSGDFVTTGDAAAVAIYVGDGYRIENLEVSGVGRAPNSVTTGAFEINTGTTGVIAGGSVTGSFEGGAFGFHLTGPLSGDFKQLADFRGTTGKSNNAIGNVRANFFYSSLNMDPVIHPVQARFMADVGTTIGGWASRANATGASRTHATFSNPGGVTGTISTLNTSTTYATTSDAKAKMDKGIMSVEDADALVRAVEIRDFDWLATGLPDHGVFAQQLHAVRPEAVVRGGWRDPETGEDWVEGGVRWINPITREPVADDSPLKLDPITGEPWKKGCARSIHSGNRRDCAPDHPDAVKVKPVTVSPEAVNAVYVPWGADPSKMVWALLRTVQGLLERVDELERS